jgi:serine/threonine protein kinase
VHRDVKPDNILLERDSGRALVTDFGIAGASSSPSTADKQYVRGTVHYLSPEQASGEPVDGRSDIYSLGVVGYLALTGQLPFDGDTAASVMVAHLSKRAAPISRIAPGVPPLNCRGRFQRRCACGSPRVIAISGCESF